VDRALVKNVLDIYIRVGMDSMDAYEADFETDLLSTTATFYKRKVQHALV
jgi:cullin 1